MKEAKAVLEIIRSYMKKQEVVVGEEVDEESLYALAKKHKVSHFLIDWAKRGCQTEKIRNEILADFEGQIMKDTNENVEFASILEKFEKENIQTLVVKGFLMKEVYPQSFMRQMCDIDLLVSGSHFRKAMQLLEELGYHKFENTEHHWVFVKEPFMVLELHRKLIHRSRNRV